MFRQPARNCANALRPSWNELKASTVVISISIFILGGFTILVSQILSVLFYFFKL